MAVEPQAGLCSIGLHSEALRVCLQVQHQLAKGNRDLAESNITKEALIGEIKNQIAIVRWACCKCQNRTQRRGPLQATHPVFPGHLQVFRVCICEGTL